MNAALMQNPEINQQFLSKIPVGQWGKVEDIGKLAVYLCAEEASFHYRHRYLDRWRLVCAIERD